MDSVYADVLARYHHQRGFDVHFLTGTDEHGAKIVRSAEAAGKTPKEFVDENAAKFRALKEVLNLSWDDFIRTSDKERHWPGAEKLWKKLSDAGDLYKKIYKGLYCVGHEAFVTEKDLVRPESDSDAKVGDNWICKDHQKAPEPIEEENWFFKLSRHSKAIQKAIKNDELRIAPESRRHEILAFIEGGLEDVSFSRPAKDLTWGVPVPGDPTQTMYVWADALVNYISALGYGGKDEKLFEKYWPADIQVIGKDNLRFHAAIWPGMLLSAGLDLPKTLFVHGFLTVDGQKISKTVGNIIDPVELVKKYGADAVRYYLLREISSFEDGDFSYEKFEALYNGDLANGLGNFAARTLTLGEKISGLAADLAKDIEPAVAAKIESVKKSFEEKIQEFKFHEASAAAWELVHFGDAYINEKKPWETGDRKAIFNCVVILDNIAALVQPLLPGTAKKITESIQWEGNALKIEKAEVLFPRLTK